jgi:membrane associated rhomboid family serine protease
MRQASVGFHCPDCVREGNAQMRQPRTAFGGLLNVGRPVVTITLIVINVVVFLIARTQGTRSEFVLTFAQTNDIDLPQFHWEGVAQGSYWQLITSNFVHLDFLHIAFNMFALWIFGGFLEQQLGRWRYLALYLVSGFAASVTVYWLADDTVISLGASGAVYGLFGAALIILLRQRRDVTGLLVLLAINLAFTFTVQNISWQAHLGGLAAGLAIGAGYAYAPRQHRQAIHVAILAGVVVVSLLLVVARTAQLTA